MAEKRGLGRGLSALIGDTLPDESHARPDAPVRYGDRFVPIETVHPNPDQPRRQFDEDALEDLSRSVSEKGILQPLIVRPLENGQFQIVAGERRWRAAQMAKVHEVPVIVRDYSDEEVLEVAIIENVQRSDLNPVEEAQGYQQLVDRFGHTQEQLAQALGKSRSHIANQMRLLNLPEAALDMLRRGDISAGHARTLLTSENPIELAREIVRKGLSVRQAEALARAGAAPKQTKRRQTSGKDADTIALEGDLGATLGMAVSIDHSPSGDGGNLTIRYRSLDDLDELCQLLSQKHRLAH